MIKIIDCNLFDIDAEVICHQVNCIGTMMGSVAGQVRERFPEVFEVYRQLCESVGVPRSLLGTLCDVPVLRNGKTVVICSLFEQDSYPNGVCFTDYDALAVSLGKVREKYGDKRIAMPYRMSCSLAGGDWRIIEKIILDTFGGCDVTLCRHERI